ncbi:MAG: hypothetical protein IT379_12830, partial [Deltaproteobacteria bacterium]|nr:hypothetical protein [Deltaproteobacteria bacterium]
EVWTGARPELLHIESQRAVAAPDEELEVVLRASDLGGASIAGRARVEVVGSDGNRAVGAVRWSSDVPLATTGASRPRVRLVGMGPWLVRASMRGASASLVVWDRPRPPPLSGRGALAIRPTSLVAQPGRELEVDLRLPDTAGGAWVTLEQGSVQAGVMARRARDAAVTRVRLSVPSTARGMATLVASYVRAGRVTTATATVEVETSRALALRVQSDRTSYDQGANARVTIEARGIDGRPRDAVVSVWVSDAGYWDLGEDTYPMPREMFRLPGRSASAADGTVPVAYGADEGRHVDAFMEWNGQRQARMTFRHAWGFGGDLVRVDRAGALPDVATAFARAAGLSRANVCASAARAAGRVRLRVQDLPWDMVALRIAELTETTVWVERGVLVFSCDSGTGFGAGGLGSGSGSGIGRGSGALRSGTMRQERLEGTLRFIGLLRLGEDGREVVDLALPDHPGRWRTEVLAIADDGGGDRAGVTVHTSRALVVGFDLPAELVVGDLARGAVRIDAPSRAAQQVNVQVVVPEGLQVVEAAPTRVTLDARGHALVPIALRASREGTHALATSATSGPATDAIRRSLIVRPSTGAQPLALSAVVGPRAVDVRIPLPELASPARLSIDLDGAPLVAIEHELHQIAEPRWNLPSMRLDKLSSLVALRDALRATVGAAPPAPRTPRAGAAVEPPGRALDASLTDAIGSQLASIDTLRAVDDGIGWWTHGTSQSALTAELAWNQMRVSRHVGDGVWAFLVSRVERNRLTPYEVPIVAAALASGGAARHPHARRLLASLDAVTGDDLQRDTWALRAAVSLGDVERIRSIASRLRASIERTFEQRRPSATCAGPAWFLCFSRWGTRGVVARAARTLVDASAWRPTPRRSTTAAAPTAPAPVVEPAEARALAARAADWLGLWPAERGFLTWGSGEAEVIALLAALGASDRSSRRFTVTLDGRRLGAGDGSSVVTVANGRELLVRFPASPGRAAILRVRADLRVAPPSGNVGPAGLARRFELGEQGWSLVVGFDLARDTERVELGVPMPAGVSLAGAADRTTLSIRSSGESTWRQLDDPRAAGTPRVELDDGALRVRWRDVRRGRHELRIPLVAVSAGEFRAAPGWLHTSDDGAWGLTPEVTLRVDAMRAASP